MIQAMGLVELTSIAKGFAAADAMLKAAAVELLEAKPTCPGKYIALVAGDVAAVQSAVDAGVAIGGEAVVDEFVLANVHPAVIAALGAVTETVEINAVGIIETYSIATLITAADAAVKAAQVNTVEIRIGTGIGGKSFTTLTGDVAAVTAAVEAGGKVAGEKGVLADVVVIPAPHWQLKNCLL